MPIAVTAEQLALQESIRAWAAAADPQATVRALEPTVGSPVGITAWHRHWADLTELGILSIALPDCVGGAGGDPCDLAAALEQITDALVPGPVMPTLLAGLVLTPDLGSPGVAALLSLLADGHASVAVAFGTGTMAAVRSADGQLRVCGRAGPVLGAGATSHLLLGATLAGGGQAGDGEAGGGEAGAGEAGAAVAGGGEAWFVLPADHPGVRVAPRTPVDFSRPLADVELSDAVIPPDRLVRVRLSRVRDVAALLGAVEATAVAAWCLRTAVAHAAVRHQFGRPIGSFQAVKHLCADMLCRAERASALAWDAARALDRQPDEFPLAAAAAAAIALDAGVQNAKDCIQVLGGMGFTWAHDAHLYLRRALVLRQLLGDGAVWRHRVAELALAGARRSVQAGTAGVGPAEVADGARLAARSRLAEIATLAESQQRAALADAGYLAPEWPPPYGLGAVPAHQLIIDEELSRAGLVRPELAIAGWAVPTILRHGTDAQRERFAGPSLRGELTWCQLFSEPEAGSDLAALRTRAHRVPGGWRLTGQKIWTSLAEQADWGICLARTDPEAPKHRGIGYFLVAMDSPGIDIRPLREITGRAVFNEVFLDDVFVPDECLVGAPGDGWRLARGTLAYERVAMGRGSSLGDGVERLLETVRCAGLAEQPGVADRLGALVADGLAMSLLDLRATLRRLGGAQGGAEAAVAKLVGVGHRQAVAEAALLCGGPAGAIADGTAAEQVHEFLLTRCLSIAGGTTQILLTVVAERVLGLPRDEAR